MLFQNIPYDEDTEVDTDNDDNWDDRWDSSGKRDVSKETAIE